MGRRKRRRSKDKRKGNRIRRYAKGRKPDEMFQHGPFVGARFGRVNVFQNLMNEAQHAEFVARAAADYPIVCAEISANARAAIDIVRQVDPASLLQRLFFDFVMVIMEAKPEESSHGPKELVAKDMITYVPKLVCAVGPTGEAPHISDEQYKELRGHVEALSALFTPRYYIARTAVLKQRPDYDSDLDEFGMYAEEHAMHVSGDRYSFHEAIHMAELLAEHDVTLRRVFGVSVDDVVRGVKAIQYSLSAGLRDASNALHDAHDAFKKFIDDKPNATMAEVEAFVATQKADGRLDKAGEEMFGLALFDVARITGWPQPFIDALSVVPGTDQGFIKHPDRGGWPTQPSQMTIRPFILVDGRALVINQAHCMDTLYRAIEHALVSKAPAQRQGWNERQKRSAERLALAMLAKVLPGARIIPNVHYQVLNPSTGKPEWMECDGVVIYDNHLIVGEVKGGAFTLKAPALNPQPHLDSLKELLRDPIEQGRRLVRELRAHGKLDLFDDQHNQIVTIENTFDSVTILCATLDQLTDYAPQIEHFRLVGIDRTAEPVWVLSIDDLRVVTELLHNPVLFMHFVQERLRGFSSPAIRMVDELDHLGAYFEHNMYGDYAEDFNAESPMGWIGYRDKIDRHYHDRMMEKPEPEPVRSPLPGRIADALTVLAQQRKPGHVIVGKKLLDAHPDARTDLAAMIDECLALQAQQGRMRPISTEGDFRVTVIVNQVGRVQTSFERATMHGHAVLQASGDEDRVLLSLDFDEGGRMTNVDFALLTKASAKAVGEETLGPLRQRLIETRRSLDESAKRRPSRD